MKTLLSFFVFVLNSLFIPDANAYGLAVAIEQRNYRGFYQNLFSYSSMFRQGRDYFHWVDLSYSSYDYLLQFEKGNSDSVGTSYRFAHRQRWGRYFKPLILVGAGLSFNKLSDRVAISEDNVLAGALPNKNATEFNLLLGTGYLWEIKGALISMSLNYGYDFGHREPFYSPSLIFSFDL